MASVDDVIAANATMSDAAACDPAVMVPPMTDAVMDGTTGPEGTEGPGTGTNAHARGRRDRGDRRDRDRRGDRDRGRRFDRGDGRFRERAPTRPGWHQTGVVDQTSGRLEHSGQCEGCGVSTVVNFRPVVGGNPPLCGVCLDSLKAATAAGGGGGGQEDRAGGPHRGGGRGRRGGGGRGGGFGGGGRGVGGFHPYGAPGAGQIVMVDPRMMAAYGAGPGGAMMAPYGGAPGGGAGRGKNRSWTRDGAAAAAAAGGGEHDVDTSGIPCIFFQRGSCRAGDACKYSHGGSGDAVGGGGGDAAMSS